MPPRPLAGLIALAVGLAAALLYAVYVMGAPRRDVEQIAVILAASGGGSLLLSTLVMHWGGGRLASLRLRLALAYGIGLFVVLVNVVAASALMFINSHDLAFLLLLLGFSGAISLGFGFSAGSALVEQLGMLARSAGRLAAGDLSARVDSRGADEVARLAAAFNHMAAQLQTAFERERGLESSRRDLIASVSHDLRTPLATTRAMVEAMTDGVVSDPSEVRRYLHLILGEVQHLSRLIEDLFELSQIESGALELRRSPTRVADLLSLTLAAYQARSRDRGVVLAHEAAPQLPRIDADAARLQRVLRNRVDNALQFTPPGGEIQVSARAEGGVVQFSVSDNGPGIPAADLERIFDRFYRGERARSRTDGAGGVVGAGLGLAIARGLVQAHGGRIWAECVGNGTTFHFTVPVNA